MNHYLGAQQPDRPTVSELVREARAFASVAERESRSDVVAMGQLVSRLADALESSVARPSEPFEAAAKEWERLKLPAFLVDGYYDGVSKSWTVPECLRFVNTRLQALQKDGAP